MKKFLKVNKENLIILAFTLFCLYLVFPATTVKANDTIYQSYVIKDPYPSKLAYAFSLIETPYFITLRIDNNRVYWYTMNFIEPNANTSLAWAVIKSLTGTATSGAYDTGTDTLNAYYKQALGVE